MVEEHLTALLNVSQNMCSRSTPDRPRLEVENVDWTRTAFVHIDGQPRAASKLVDQRE